MDHISGYKLSDAKCIVIEDILAYLLYFIKETAMEKKKIV